MRLDVLYPPPSAVAGRPLRHGDRLLWRGGSEYIIAATGYDQVCLISLDDGNRWVPPTKVSDSLKLNYDDVLRMIGSSELDEWDVIYNPDFR